MRPIIICIIIVLGMRAACTKEEPEKINPQNNSIVASPSLDTITAPARTESFD